MDHADQKFRLEALVKIIEKQRPSSQVQIIQYLEQEYQIEATQAMVSRDLKKLGAVLKQEEGKRIYALPEKDAEMQMLQLAVTGIQYNESMIVVATTDGTAPFVGDKIDAARLEVLGCLAGENAIFVAPKSIKNIKRVYQELCKALYYNQT